MIELLRELFLDYTLRNVALGASLLGVVSGVLGTFAVLRRQSLLGDALAHAALPGICLAFLITGSKDLLVLLIGGGLSGWLATLFIMHTLRETPRISEDSALGIALATFFGAGIVLLTIIARRSDAHQAGLDKFLFGQAATLVAGDVRTMAVLGLLALGVVAIFYKEFKLITFDAEFAHSLGFNTRFLGVLLTSLVAVAVVIGLRTVGVVLMAAMLVGPAVAARQWTNRLGIMILVSSLIGAASGVTGAMLSVTQSQLPTGPMIILALTGFVLLSLFFAPARGLVWEWMRRARQRGRLMAPPLPVEYSVE